MRTLIKGCVIYGTFYPMTFEIFRNSRNLTRGYYRSIFSTVHNSIQVSTNTKRNIDVKNPYVTLTIRKIDRNISKSLCNCFNKSINSVRNEPSFLFNLISQKEPVYSFSIKEIYISLKMWCTSVHITIQRIFSIFRSVLKGCQWVLCLGRPFCWSYPPF